jgi:hypothetical protein
MKTGYINILSNFLVTIKQKANALSKWRLLFVAFVFMYVIKEIT